MVAVFKFFEFKKEADATLKITD